MTHSMIPSGPRNPLFCKNPKCVSHSPDAEKYCTVFCQLEHKEQLKDESNKEDV
jgi:hypothetical protein